MVLPGIGAFTVIDAAMVTAADVGVNYFLTVDDIGKSRAKATAVGLIDCSSID